jgi:hypothetical protein
MKVKILKRRSITEMVEVKREKSLQELMEENDKLVKKLDDQFNNILAEIKIVNRILKDKLERSNEQD